MTADCTTMSLGGPGIFPGCENQRVLRNVYLRSDLSRSDWLTIMQKVSVHIQKAVQKAHRCQRCDSPLLDTDLVGVPVC